MNIATKRGRGGFTLVEVVVVLVILAILAAIMIPSMTGWIDKAHASVCKNDMAFVRRSYLSLAAFDAYEVDDARALLEEAVAETDGTVTSETTYNSACGGVCTVYYSADKSQITNIVCSLHGSLNAQTDGLIYDASSSPAAAFDSILSNLVDAGKVNLRKGSGIDSTTVTGTNYAKVMDYLSTSLGVNLNSFGIKSWCISKTEGSSVVWWSDQDITACSPGESVRVIRYNPAKKTFTAGYVTISQKTFEGKTYNVFASSVTGNVTSCFTPCDGQTDATKADYKQTLNLYNNLSAKP
ncbi:MAG: prepilin-type N-terminal cleavage/methylation domain-containing protein [Oscillospiraceae bacterium]|nr:prepilin-type N-terminal cleavage/methylation domain-containing protein [Oscillospiraceae bacterium]